MELSPLVQAASDGNIEEIKKAMADGSDINEVAKNGSTALIVAAQNNHPNTVCK